jgi:hypothetical protein
MGSALQCAHSAWEHRQGVSGAQRKRARQRRLKSLAPGVEPTRIQDNDLRHRLSGRGDRKEKGMNIKFLTDRWGDKIEENLARTTVENDAIAQLVPMMWDEMTFVVRLDNVVGILIEMEFDDDFEPPADRRAWWENEQPECDGSGIRFIAAKGDANIPVFNDRWAWWCFIPADKASLDLIERIGRRMLDDTLGKVAA